jgi:hypothetical protein
MIRLNRRSIKRLKIATATLNSIYLLTMILLLLDDLTYFNIKAQILKSAIYMGLLIGTPTIIAWNVFLINSQTIRFISLIVPVSALIAILILGPKNIILAQNSWKTQAILYKHGHLSFKRIEFQMKDLGAHGYNQRNVKVIYISQYFMIASPVSLNDSLSPEWIRSDIDVNELGLK